MLHSKLIDKKVIFKLFEELSKNYEKLGGFKEVNIYLIGGAAIVLNFAYRLSTIDIDAFFVENKELKKAIEITGKQFKLNDDWLNCDFVNTPSFSKEIVNKADCYAKFGKYISIFAMPAKYMIAMKLKSSRPTGGDLDDVIKMIYESRLNEADLDTNRRYKNYI